MLGAAGVAAAAREAVAARRKELGLRGWFALNVPATRQRVRAAADGEDEEFERRMRSGHQGAPREI